MKCTVNILWFDWCTIEMTNLLFSIIFAYLLIDSAFNLLFNFFVSNCLIKHFKISKTDESAISFTSIIKLLYFFRAQKNSSFFPICVYDVPFEHLNESTWYGDMVARDIFGIYDEYYGWWSSKIPKLKKKRKNWFPQGKNTFCFEHFLIRNTTLRKFCVDVENEQLNETK